MQPAKPPSPDQDFSQAFCLYTGQIIQRFRSNNAARVMNSSNMRLFISKAPVSLKGREMTSSSLLSYQWLLKPHLSCHRETEHLIASGGLTTKFKVIGYWV